MRDVAASKTDELTLPLTLAERYELGLRLGSRSDVPVYSVSRSGDGEELRLYVLPRRWERQRQRMDSWSRSGAFPEIVDAEPSASSFLVIVRLREDRPLLAEMKEGPFGRAVAARLIMQLCRELAKVAPPIPLRTALDAKRLDVSGEQDGELNLHISLLPLLFDTDEELPANSPRDELLALWRLLQTLAGDGDVLAVEVLLAVLERADDDGLVAARCDFVSALAPIAAAVSGPHPTLAEGGSALRTDEDVQVTVFRPKNIVAERWYRLLAFVHTGARSGDAHDPLQEIQERAQAALGLQVAKYRSTTQDAEVALPEGGLVLLVPRVEGVEFNPPSRSFSWRELIHEESFQLRARSAEGGCTLRGSLSAYLGTILLAEVTLVFALVADDGAAVRMRPERSASYRKIFASYSHQDARVVSDFDRFARALGDRYLRDVQTLRSGEVWNDALKRLIDNADIFQLFWSTSSMRSTFCRQEWEYALQTGKPIRPVYWENPMPQDAGLPPPNLARLHFAHFPTDDASPESSMSGGLSAAEPDTESPEAPLPTAERENTFSRLATVLPLAVLPLLLSVALLRLTLSSDPVVASLPAPSVTPSKSESQPTLVPDPTSAVPNVPPLEPPPRVGVPVAPHATARGPARPGRAIAVPGATPLRIVIRNCYIEDDEHTPCSPALERALERCVDMSRATRLPFEGQAFAEAHLEDGFLRYRDGQVTSIRGCAGSRITAVKARVYLSRGTL